MRHGPTYLPPRVLQVVGLVFFAGFAVFWALTGRESVLLVTAAGSLILLGGYRQAGEAVSEVLRNGNRESSP